MPDLMEMSQRTTLLLQGLGLNPREVEEELSRRSVLVSLPEDQAHSEDGQAILALSLQLLLRLGVYCPQTQVLLPDGVPVIHRSPLLLGEEEDLKSSLMKVVQDFNPTRVHFVGRRAKFPESDMVLNIGTSGDVLGPSMLYVSNDGWLISSRPKLLPDDHTTSNPIGAYLAATLGANELWKGLMWGFLKGKPEFRRIDSLVFSAFDYSINDQQAPNPPLPDPINLGDLILIGLGGIGSAFIAGLIGLASSHQVRGRLLLVDSDLADWTDANRHLLWTPQEVGHPKVLRAERLLRNISGLKVHAHLGRYQELSPSEIDREALVIVGVDNEETREAVQYRHRRILLGGYRELTSMIARIHAPYTACLGCFSALGLTGNLANPAPSIGFSSVLTGLLLLEEVLKERYFRHLSPPLNMDRNVLIIALEGAPHESSLLLAPKVSDCSLCEHIEFRSLDPGWS